jgi:hypothetical protein
MYAKNIELASLTEAASQYGFQLNAEPDPTKKDPSRIKFTLRLGSNTKYRHISRSWSGDRKTNSVCLHGHYHFFKTCFAFATDAEFESSWYGKIVHTADTLEDNYERMRWIQVGSQVAPCSLQDSCDCGE